MPYPQHFIRLSFGGTMAYGNEIWSCNLHIAESGTTPSDPTTWFAAVTTNMQALTAPISVWFSSPAAQVPNGVKLKWFKASLIGLDGKTVGEPVWYDDDSAGAIQRGYLPQAAMVYTFVSNIYSRGAGRYNRFYLPVAPPVANGDYSIVGSDQQGMALSCANMISDVNEILHGTVGNQSTSVSIVSQTAPLGYSEVGSVQVGQIIDTQQRRRNSLAENYVSYPVPAS